MIKKYILSADDFATAGEASSNFKAMLKKLGLAPETVRRVSIAMYEAEINTIVHGGGGECDAEISPKAITLVFTDHGPGITNVDLAMQEGYSTATAEVRGMGFGAGMGLPNIKKYTDYMDIATTVGVGTTVTMKVFVK